MKRTTALKSTPYLFLFLVSLALTQVPGCGGGGGDGGGGGATTGTVQLAITDAPPVTPSYASVNVTITKVLAVPAGKEGAQDSDASLPVLATFPAGKKVNILQLHFIPEILGTTAIPAGTYNQIRLVLAPNTGAPLSNYVTLTGNTNQQIPLATPGDQQSGAKIVGTFKVTAGVVNTIVLDFNPTTAIVVQGNGKYSLKPTGIHILQTFNSLANAGSVTGTIRSPQFFAWSSATVTVVPRNPGGGSAVTSGVAFSNFTSNGYWNGPFTALLPPNGSATVPSANYKLFVQAYRGVNQQTPLFGLYSSPIFTVTSNVDTPVPPGGIVQLGP